MKLKKYKQQIRETFFILVLYQKKLSESFTFQSMNRILKDNNISIDLFIYDNSPKTMVDINHQDYTNINIICFHDKSNPGISTAYNEGHKIAKNLNKKWIVLFDQDTKFTEELFVNYFDAVNNNDKIFLFAPILMDQDKIFSPCRYLLKRGFRLKNIKQGIQPIKHIGLLNSGMFISIIAFEQTGGYNEEIKLDFADFEFLERFKKYYKYFYLINVRCKHQFASDSDQNKEIIISRYKIYCNSAIHFSTNFNQYIILMFWAFARGIKLFFKHHDLAFFLIFIKYYLMKNKIQ